MILKQRFTNGNEQNTYLGRSYTLIERRFNPEGWKGLYQQHFGFDDNIPNEENEAVAFINYNDGISPKTIPLYPGNYNAVMSDGGQIYNVITCMPF